MKQVPMIEKYMTAMPHTVNPDVSIKTAMHLMREYQIRHLPVQKGGKLVGILTDRDVKLAATLKDAESFHVEDVMTMDPFTVSPQAALDQVVVEMAEHKFGCAIVQQDNGKVVGIFTATDGLRVLGEVLKTNYKPIQH